MIRFRMVVAGEVQMDRGIARFADGLTDYRPVWPVIVDDLQALFKRQFETEGEAGGEKWAPLKPETAAWKEVHYPGQPILQRTGDLYRSLADMEHDPNGVVIQERKTLTTGTRVPYAIYHQTGTQNMAARPEIQLTEQFKRTSMHHIQQHLVQMATKLGFRNGRVPGTPFPTSAGSAESFRRSMALGF